MISGEIKFRIRYSHTDKMGYLYYGRYANFYEAARVELFRSLGFSYKKLEDEFSVNKNKKISLYK